MRRLLNKLNKNLLLKVASYNSVLVVVKIGIGAVMSKIIAFYVGTAGLALMGNLRNFTQSLYTISTLGLENGLVKKTAEFSKHKEQLKSTFNSGWFLVLIASLLTGLLVALCAPLLNDWLFSGYDYKGVFVVFGISLPFYVVFVLVSTLLQGLEIFKKFITINIVGSVLSFAVSAVLAIQLNVLGALYAIVAVPFIQFLVILGFSGSIERSVGMSMPSLFTFNTSKPALRSLLSFSFLALFSAFVVPFVNILVRQELRFTLGDEPAGYWEAMVRISTYYMMFATSLISMYVLPGFSKDDSASNFRKVAGRFYKTILPLVMMGMITVFLCRDLLIQILYNEDFMPVTQLFKWQLTGDFIRIVTFVLAFRIIALNDIKRYLIAEILSVASFYLFSLYFIDQYGLEGVTIAYLANYVFYALVLVILLRKELFYR